jgi:hypothetical protein
VNNLNNSSILSNVVYGVPSGNYDGSSLDWASDAVPAADYYRGNGSIQTINIIVDNFIGNIVLEGSLNSTSTTKVWFNIQDYNCANATTATQSYTVIGNYVWMRARIINFTQGNISNVTLVY